MDHVFCPGQIALEGVKDPLFLCLIVLIAAISTRVLTPHRMALPLNHSPCYLSLSMLALACSKEQMIIIIIIIIIIISFIYSF